MSARLTFLAVVIAFLSACGSSPAPFRFAKQEQEKTVIAQNNTTAVNAVKNSPPSGTPSGSQEKQPEQTVARPLLNQEPPSVLTPILRSEDPGNEVLELSPREHLTRSIAALQRGNESTARIHLQAMLRMNPEDPVAKSLLLQIEQPATSFFERIYGSRYFTYQTRDGDSLSTIALQFLDDRYKFYGLAKYNQIEDPSLLRVGQVIRIPGERPAGPLVRTPTSHEDSYYRTAKGYFDQARYQDVIDLLESSDAKISRGERSTDILVLAYSEQAKIYAEKADLINARVILERALKIRPDNKDIKGSLQEIQNKLDVGKYWELADQQIQSGNLREAYVALREVIKRDPNHELANKQVKRIKPLVVDNAYRDCMLAYRRQEFTEAVNLCDKVLAIEPDHELAKLQRARAYEISVKLKIITNTKPGDEKTPGTVKNDSAEIN